MEELRDIKVSIDDFKKLRKEGFNYYVDKSFLIKQLVKPSDKSFDINLVLRPRRFGKTLNQSMLKYFFDIKEADNKDLFNDLEISKDKNYCIKHQNQYPVLFLTFKGLEGKSKEGMLDRMNSTLSREFIRHKDAIDYLEKENDKMKFKRLYEGNATYSDYRDSIFIYTEALSKQYNKNVLILLDEYDVPLSYAYNNDFFDEYADVFRDMLHQSLKSNNYCMGAVITGCLQIAKNQLFTGLNNLKINSVVDSSLMNTSYGFTKEEVRKMLVYYGLEDKEAVIEDWYDGYRFNDIEIYNPFSVLNYISALMSKQDITPMNYWANTSGNVLLKKMLASSAQDDSIKDKFEALVNKKGIKTKYSTTVTYDDMLKNEAAIFGTLLFCGYLTLDKDGMLYIPNKEVIASFIDLTEEYNTEKKPIQNPKIVKAILSNNIASIEHVLNDIMNENISINDVTSIKEYAYHNFVSGLLSATDKESRWKTRSNIESGIGYPDILFYNDKRRLAYVLEIKRATTEEEVPQKLTEATKQIRTQKYGASLVPAGFTVYRIGMSFYKKTVKVRALKPLVPKINAKQPY